MSRPPAARVIDIAVLDKGYDVGWVEVFMGVYDFEGDEHRFMIEWFPHGSEQHELTQYNTRLIHSGITEVSLGESYHQLAATIGGLVLNRQ